MSRPIAYSYARFSTPQQADGDSERRQRDAARAYAAAEGLILDESYETDKGLSAYSGKNLLDGAFARILTDIRSGKIAKGSILIVESLDRISRLPVKKASKVIDEILEHGIKIYELAEKHLYTEEEDFTDIIIRIVRAERANNESKQKSQRLTAVWGEKKHRSAPRIAITNRLPGWLDGKTHGLMTVNPAKAKIVVQIFEMAAAATGKRLIARRLNEKKVPTFGKSPTWGHSYVQKILLNRTVLGEYQPHKGRPGNRTPEGEIRTDFFPAVITPELWDRAHRAISGRHTIC
jgi:DNA invertase Pin-like site-specific DNA recombinase